MKKKDEKKYVLHASCFMIYQPNTVGTFNSISFTERFSDLYFNNVCVIMVKLLLWDTRSNSWELQRSNPSIHLSIVPSLF